MAGAAESSLPDKSDHRKQYAQMIFILSLWESH